MGQSLTARSPWGEGLCSVRPKAGLWADERGSISEGRPGPRRPRAGESSCGAVGVVGAGALVQGAVLEAGGGKCEVGFGSEAKFCGVGGDSAEDRLGSGGR